MNAKLGGALVLLVVVSGVMRCSGESPAALPAPSPTTEVTTTIHFSGTIERPGGLLTERKGGAVCNSQMTDGVRANVLWWITAGRQSLGGGRLGQGQVRHDVNPYGLPVDGPCTFPFADTVQMPAGGDVILNIAHEKFSVNRLDLLAGPITIRTNPRGDAYLAQTCPDKAYSC